MNGWYFVLGVIAFQLIKILYLAIDHELRERRQRRFLRAVHVEFPDSTTRTFIAIDTSDKKAMAKLEKEIRARSE
jgi:hypothetical protein